MINKHRKVFEHAVGVLRCRRGETALEYALVAVFITIVLIFAFRNAHVDSGISTAASKVQCTLETPP